MLTDNRSILYAINHSTLLWETPIPNPSKILKEFNLTIHYNLLYDAIFKENFTLKELENFS